MRIFGLEVRRIAKALNPVPALQAGWRIISEPWTGAWQRNQEEKRGTLACYPVLYRCMSMISSDIGTLPFVLKEVDEKGIWKPADRSAFSPVLREPNHYQTAQQFREAWILSKLQQGNTYVLKRRDNRGVVTALYVLDPYRVQPMVSDSGDVFYELWSDNLSPLLGQAISGKTVVVPAREIIHDRANALHHQLIGVPPLLAAYWAAVKNMRILRSSAEFFANGARPGGILTAPQGISDEKAEELKSFWNTNFQGENSGKVAVLGADIKYTPLGENSVNSQMVEQMRYSDEQICFAFGIKPHKIGIAPIPGGWKSDDVNVEYYGDALRAHIEAMENLLDQGLGISRPLGVELDPSPLWRMDEGKQAEVESKLVSAKIKTPDEARKRFDLSATGGGDTLWGQHQDYPLGYLAQRNDLNPEPAPEPAEETDDEIRAVARLLTRRIPDPPTLGSEFDAVRELATAH